MKRKVAGGPGETAALAPCGRAVEERRRERQFSAASSTFTQVELFSHFVALRPKALLHFIWI